MFLILFQGFLSLLGGIIGGIYFIIIGPALFRYWIIPKITSRFNKICEFDYSYASVHLPGAKWSIPPLEISWYICSAYMQWKWPIKRYHMGPMRFFKNIEYDINKATKAEIVMSFVTMGNILMIIGCGIISISLDKIFL